MAKQFRGTLSKFKGMTMTCRRQLGAVLHVIYSPKIKTAETGSQTLT